MSSYFLSGDATDPAYINVRDSPNLVEAKAFVESLWLRYQAIADTNHLSDARNHFLQRFWEMYLACTLIERGIEVHRVGDAGPEFYFLEQGRRVWVEAVAPTAGEGADQVPDIVPGEAFMVPSEKVVLRFTNAYRTKSLKFHDDVKKGRVNEDDLILLAINSRGVPHGPFGGDMPFFLKAFLPFGNLTLEIDRRTRRVVDRYHKHRPVIMKKNQSSVGTAGFLDPESGPFVGVLHSAVDCANQPLKLGDDFHLLHNPSASWGLPIERFEWCTQYEYAENELRLLVAR
ncbi:hypothetical protein AZ34_12725 [Hylemonella gracilis str. Niagara R]|uniref:Uncharacterized protein n=1 Tax=Hylemonella gracilis str. Niagara R TaxID=1458275 RepID=A0A016XMV5_9BURK|nr:hypothetical protein [Hylemonella gracilis]EYC52912.1 hypothetical protein AZ34_12725 [Hylemonella gracilis str. Niagara R]